MDQKKSSAEAVKHTKISQGLPTLYVQIIAFVFLIVMFVTDKVTHVVAPPLESYWYIGVSSIAFFGVSIAEKLFDKLN